MLLVVMSKAGSGNVGGCNGLPRTALGKAKEPSAAGARLVGIAEPPLCQSWGTNWEKGPWQGLGDLGEPGWGS